MTEKKNNFLPLLLVGGGVGIAALLYNKANTKTQEDTSLLSGGGFGGSGDFFGNSQGTITPSGGVNVPSSGGVLPSGAVSVPSSAGSTPVILPMLYPDSMDAGIEDIARDDTNLGLTDHSNGGVNPTNYSTDGTDIFSDLALYAGVTAGVSAAGYGIKKAAQKVATSTAGKVATSAAGKVATSTAGKVANTAAAKAASTAAGKAAGTAAGSVAGKVLGTAAKGAGVLGLLGAVDMLFDVTGVKEAHFSQGGLTGNLQGVNTSFSVNTGGLTTDKATSQEVGNTTSEWKQTYESQKAGTTGAKGNTQTWQHSSGEQIAFAGISAADAAKYYESKGKTETAAKYSAVASASKSSGGSSKSSGGSSKSSGGSSKSSGGSSKSSGGSSKSSGGGSVGSAVSSAVSSVSSFFSGLFGGK